MLRCRLESLEVSWPGGRIGAALGSLLHAVWAGKKCLARSSYRPADVEVLINTGVHRDGHVCEPAIAAYVLNELGINVEFRGARTLGFDLLNGGCGVLSAAQVLSTLMQSGQIRVGMITASEANSDRRPDPGYPYPRSGAAAILDVSPLSTTGFGAFSFCTHEEHAGLYTSEVDLSVRHGRLVLRRQPGLEAAYLAGAAEVVEAVLAQDGLRRDEIALLVPAQISPGLVAALGRATGFPADKILDLTDRLGDTLSTSLLLAWHEALRTGRLGPGDRALLLAFGAGVTVGAATYHH